MNAVSLCEPMNLTLEVPKDVSAVVLSFRHVESSIASEAGAAEYDSWSAGAREYASWGTTN